MIKWEKELDMVGQKSSNERSVATTKQEVVLIERDKQADYQAKYDATVVRIEEIGKINTEIRWITVIDRRDKNKNLMLS